MATLLQTNRIQGGAELQEDKITQGACDEDNSDEDTCEVPNCAEELSTQEKKKAKKKRNRAKKKASSQTNSEGTKPTISLPVKSKVNTTLDSRDVAKAAGVNWGEDEATLRMVELQKRHNDIVDVAEAGKLTLLHIKEHNEFLATLTRQIADG
jgi:hypothetical protein